MTKTPKKECFRCHVPKPLTQFYAHPGMADGHLGKCKDCTKTDTISNRNSKPEYYQEYENSRSRLPHRVAARKRYAATDEGRAAGNRAKQAWTLREPIKVKAGQVLASAIKTRKLVRGTECKLCGSTQNIEGHHEDYSRPLEVIWLCKPHHWQADERRRTAEKSQNVISSQEVMTATS